MVIIMKKIIETKNYSDVFSDILREEFCDPENASFGFIERVREHYKANADSPYPTVAELFPGRTNNWLSKELQKWKKKVTGEVDTFSPTLQNLYIFCLITSKTPNAVLMPGKAYYGPDEIEYLSLDALKSLVSYLQTIRSLENDHTVPVLLAPEKMVAAFLSIYSRIINNQEIIYVQFILSSAESCYGSEDDQLGGMKTVPTSSDDTLSNSGEVKITGNKDALTKFEKAYNNMKAEFEIAKADLNTIVVDEFYSEFSNWIRRSVDNNSELTRYFPVPYLSPQDDKGSVLNSIPSGTKERER